MSESRFCHILFCLLALAGAILVAFTPARAAALSGCAKCHTDGDRLDELTAKIITETVPAEKSPLQQGQGCVATPAPFDLYEKILVKPTFLETTHGKKPCQDCHKGNPESDDPATAHQGMVRDPSLADPEAACGSCHGDIVKTAKDSLHTRPTVLLDTMRKRCTPQQWQTMQEKQVAERHCLTCHTASCGTCHVSRPVAAGGGLVEGHVFKKTPEFVYQCASCHTVPVANDFTGDSSLGDVHYRDAHMVCTDCHGGQEMHALGLGVQGRDQLPQRSHCTDCHKNLEQGPIRLHDATHLKKMTCTVCHAQAYMNCGTCHLSADKEGKPVAQGDLGRVELKIGLNAEHNGKGKKTKFVLVRQIPVMPDTYKAYLGEDLGNFNAMPTYKYTGSPHNIQRKTWQAAHCNNCHGNHDLFLTQKDVPAALQAANKAVIVPEKRIPAAIPGLTPMSFNAPPLWASPARVNVDWLQEHLHDPDLLILDVRNREPYEESHIAGAYNMCSCYMRSKNTDKPPFAIHAPEKLAAVLQEHLPLTPDKRVVIYDDGSATRGLVFLALERIGHTKVSFLEGGFATWEAAGLPTEEGGNPGFEPVAPYPVHAKDVIIETRELRIKMETNTVILIDARKVSQHLGHGEHKPAHHAGHIPGAVNLPLRTLINTKGEVLPPDKLVWYLRNIHVYPGVRATLVTSCNTNQLAAEMYMILRSLGYENVVVHGGSWVEWAEMTK